MTSQLVIFRTFLFIFFLVPPTLNLKKKSRKSTNKKILALSLIHTGVCHCNGNICDSAANQLMQCIVLEAPSK